MIPGNREHMGIGAGTFLGDYYDTHFVPVHADYQQKYVLWNNPATRTPDVTKDFLNAEKALKKIFRKIYAALFKSPAGYRPRFGRYGLAAPPERRTASLARSDYLSGFQDSHDHHPPAHCVVLRQRQ